MCYIFRIWSSSVFLKPQQQPSTTRETSSVQLGIAVCGTGRKVEQIFKLREEEQTTAVHVASWENEWARHKPNTTANSSCHHPHPHPPRDDSGLVQLPPYIQQGAGPLVLRQTGFLHLNIAKALRFPIETAYFNHRTGFIVTRLNALEVNGKQLGRGSTGGAIAYLIPRCFGDQRCSSRTCRSTPPSKVKSDGRETW